MNQLLSATLGLTVGAVSFAAASHQYISMGMGIVVVALIVWHIRRQRNEREKL